MLIMQIGLIGCQTKTHCSMGSSIGACEKLNIPLKRCRLYKKKLEYDWNTHAYERCKECIKAEIA